MTFGFAAAGLEGGGDAAGDGSAAEAGTERNAMRLDRTATATATVADGVRTAGMAGGAPGVRSAAGGTDAADVPLETPAGGPAFLSRPPARFPRIPP